MTGTTGTIESRIKEFLNKKRYPVICMSLNDTSEKKYLSKLENFIKGFAASHDLLPNAAKNGCFIECVIILANQIDALLRYAIILHNQIEGEASKIEQKYIYQGKNDKPILEKNIYSEAKNKKIITVELYERLHSIYNARNEVVHRYIISEIKTSDVLEITIKYFQLYRQVYEIVDDLEMKQLDLGNGLKISCLPNMQLKLNEAVDIFKNSIKEKHGKIDFDNPPEFQ